MIPPIDTLRIFAADPDNNCPMEIEEITKIFVDANHYHPAEYLAYFALRGMEPKCGTLWLHGLANTGKSEFCRSIKVIFPQSHEWRDTQGRFYMEMRRLKVTPPFIIVDEAAIDKMFSRF